MTVLSRVERMDWDPFISQLDWRQGDHVSIVAPTGCGKTVLITQLQKLRTYLCVIGVKPKDESLEVLTQPQYGGFEKMITLPKSAAKHPHVLIWPKPRSARDYGWQAQVVQQAMDDIWTQQNWCLVVDEVGYLIKRLGLRTMCEQIWEVGRSLGISFLSATQRPRHVPLTMWSSASHLFLGGTNDVEDLRRLSGLNGADTALVKDVLKVLPTKQQHDWLYVSLKTGQMCIVKPTK